MQKGFIGKFTTVFAAAASLFMGTSAGAETLFSTTELQLHYGDGFRLGRNGFDETDRTILTLDHFTATTNGELFFFVDLSRDHEGPDSTLESDHYAEVYYKFNGSNFGLDFGDGGLISDIGPEFGINHGRDFLAAIYGVRANFNIPGLQLFTAGLYAYDNVTDPFNRDLDTTYIATIVWNAPFELGNQKFGFNGFLDVIGDQGSGVDDQIIFSPQLRWDVGHAFGGQEGRYNLGLEYTHFANKFGVTGVDDNSLSVFLGVRF